MKNNGNGKRGNWIDRAVAHILPERGLRRLAARRLYEVMPERRDFDSISHSRIRHDWTNVTKDADAANISSLTELRNILRGLAQTSGIISGPLRRITNYVIGTGLRPQARVKADPPESISILKSLNLPTITEQIAQQVNYQLEFYWPQYVEKSDAQLRLNHYEQQALAFRAMFADGEVLGVARSSEKYGRIVPLCTEVIEIDRLATPFSELSNSKIRNGIEFDEEGVPFKYHVLKRHPGSQTLIDMKKAYETEQIDAFAINGQRKVFHLYNVLRPGQSRGYAPFAAALEDIQDRKRYREAEIVASRVGACLAAFVKSPAAYNQFLANPTNETTERLKEFQPGMIEYLQPEQSVEIFNPNRPNRELTAFLKHFDREIANAADFPYEILTGDFGGLNYSNARTILILAYICIRAYQQQMIDHWCNPHWELFATDCVLKGLVNAPGFSLRMKDYCRTQWIPPKRDWIDPQSEAEGARVDLLETNVTTLSELITGRGGDWEESLEQRAKELARVKDLEEKYGVEFQKPQQVGGQI